MQLQRDFSDYYGTDECEDKILNETISGNGSYYINNAFFSFHFRKRTISISSNSSVLLEACAFYNNSSTENGGSICIIESNCILVHLCISLSSIVSNKKSGCVYYIDPIYNNRFNYAFGCSISQCIGYESAFFHQRGDIQVSNMNTSYHKNIDRTAAFDIIIPEGIGIINFTTAFNTSSSNYCEMEVFGTCNIRKCNYLYNKYSGDTNSIIQCSSSCLLLKCTIIGNIGNSLFYTMPNIDHCFIKDNDVNQIANDYVSIDPGKPVNSHLSHYTTYYCPGSVYYYNYLDEIQNRSYSKNITYLSLRFRYRRH